MGQGLTALPPQTNLYVATFDGSRGAVYRLPLNSNPDQLRAAIANATPATPAIRAEILFDVASESVMALQVLPPLAGRTVDGQPFCDTRECLAIGTRRAAGQDGRTLLIDPQSLRAVNLAFGGPVRDFATVGNGVRLFGILDEEKCGSTACGGAVAVDTLTAVGASGFPLTQDFSGSRCCPSTRRLAADGHRAGAGRADRQSLETFDGGTARAGPRDPAIRRARCRLDVERRTDLLRRSSPRRPSTTTRGAPPSRWHAAGPGTLEDGGLSYVGPTEASWASWARASLRRRSPRPTDGSGLTEPWRITTIANPDGGTTAPDGGVSAPYVIDVSDGYLQSQTLVVIFEGQLPGSSTCPPRPPTGRRCRSPPAGPRARAAGDRAVFLIDQVVCGEGRVTAVGADQLSVDAVPVECADRTAFSVRASGDKPYVLAADLEGYLGRAAVGETLTYTRRYQVVPPGWSGVRPALQLTVGDTVPPVTGAYWAFTIDSGLVPYRMTFDATDCASPYLPSRVALAQLPTLTDKGSLAYPWEVLASSPRATPCSRCPSRAPWPARSRLDGFQCWR